MPRKPNSSERRERMIAMEREFEERFEERVDAQRRQSQPSARGQLNARRKARAKSSAKSPLLLRVLAWCGVILLCVVAGYLGADSMLKWLERSFSRDLGAQMGVPAEGTPFLPEGLDLDIQTVALSLFYPKDGVMVEGKADVVVQTREDNIRDAVGRLLSLSGLFDETVYVQHVFRNVDTVYLDFSNPFLSGLNVAGSRLSTLFITGLVRTMQENFSPVTKVRFLVDSKLVESSGAPVDLAVPWQLN